MHTYVISNTLFEAMSWAKDLGLSRQEWTYVPVEDDGNMLRGLAKGMIFNIATWDLDDGLNNEITVLTEMGKVAYVEAPRTIHA